jgi:cytochrome oxidase Cu insertion factor (SCO1/SenC/PrrC family)
MAPILEDMYAKYQNSSNVVFLSVAGPWDGPDGNPASATDAANFIKGGPVDGESNTWGPTSWTYVYDSSGTIMNSEYGVNSTPTFFVITKGGVIFTTFSGEQTEDTLTTAISNAINAG